MLGCHSVEQCGVQFCHLFCCKGLLFDSGEEELTVNAKLGVNICVPRAPQSAAVGHLLLGFCRLTITTGVMQ